VSKNASLNQTPVKHALYTRVVRTGIPLLALLLTCVSSWATSANILGFRHWSGPEHTRLVLDIDGEVSYQVQRLEKNPRIYVDLSGSCFHSKYLSKEVKDGVVRTIRLAQHDLQTVRLVADLDQMTRYKAFCLKPYMDKPHRFVLDLYRPKSVPFKGQDERTKLPHETEAESVKILVLDPGHGGEDPGAIWWGLTEKDIVLDLCQRIEKYFRDQDNVRCLLTRRGDYYVSLKRRLERLKAWNGDLFISMHVNATPTRSKANLKVRGLEVFLYSLSGPTDEAAHVLASRENASDFFGGENVSQLNEIDRLMEHWTRSGAFTENETVAVQLMSELTRMEPFRTYNRGVKKANFYVLRTGQVPSVLLELGFLSNREDASLLKTSWFRDAMALHIYNGINRYFAGDPGFQPKYRKPESIFYQVRIGDCLWDLSQKYHVSVDSICEASGLQSRRILRVGETLRIPPPTAHN